MPRFPNGHRILLRAPLETRVKRQKQRLKLLCKKTVFLEILQVSQENNCVEFLIELQTFRLAALLKRDPTQMFSCGICKIFKNT